MNAVPGPEPHFDEEEQRRIIALAVEMQRKAGGVVSASELEQAALEAGIEPRYIQAAIAQRRAELALHRDGDSTALQAAGVGVLLVAQVYIVSGQMLGAPRDVYLPVAVVLALGAIFGERKLLRGLASFALATAMVAIATYGFLSATGAEMAQAWPRYLMNLVAVQLFAYIVGFGIAAIFRRLTARGLRRLA